MHLIYTRFFHKALRDLGVTRGNEPMLQLRNQGQILGPDGQRMSKSRGNVIDPDQEVHRHGADVVRAYLMFGYRWADGGPWSSENIEGVVRWLHRVWHVAQPSSVISHQSPEEAKVLRRITHQTIKKVTTDLEAYEFNTIIAALMSLTNGLYKLREATEGSPEWNEAVDTMLLLMAPITPHIAEELWVRRGHPYSIHQQAWPVYDAAAATEEQITLVVQINGKVRDRIEVAADISEAEAKATALASEQVQKHLEGKEPKKIVYVTGKLVSIVI
jgi:leucyl-tRNA synthetase